MAILAMGISLIWGNGGILPLGQGVFFGLGGYALAMHLKLAALGPGDVARLHAMERARLTCPGCGCRSRTAVFAHRGGFVPAGDCAALA